MIQTILLGIIQGITEFLPVSSSGHLTVFQHLFGRTDFNANLTLDLSLHFATLLAVIWFFRKDLIPYFTRAGWQDLHRRNLFLAVFIGSIPTAIIGLTFKKTFETLFSSPLFVCGAFVVTGLLLLLSERKRSKKPEDGETPMIIWQHALLIGIAQGLAITPGISRSGSTIAAALLLGYPGALAARFSFLLMIPAVGGATLLEGKKLITAGLPASLSWSELSIGSLAALISGILSLRLLLYIINRQRLSLFSYYLFTAAAIFSIIFLVKGS